MKYHFILVKEEPVANKLKQLGFNFISENNGAYFFVNDRPIAFSEMDFDKTKIAYTNMLFV